MKNKIFFFLILTLQIVNVKAETLFIQSKNISLDKNNEISVFENDVLVKTDNENTIKSDYAEYNKKNGHLILRNNVTAYDIKNNVIEADFAEYFEESKILKSKGLTKITTSENYIINGEDIVVNNKSNSISSDKKTIITDQDENKIYLENFEFFKINNIFKSIGYVKIEDKLGNVTEFSQIYIDTKKKEILGTDIKAFLNQKDFKADEDNKPRIFANTMKMNKDENSFGKSIFTLCDYRENDKCPPWTIQASEMLHDNKKKTIYYNNAVIKVYNIPIFYSPRLSHPDPTVDRRSGFLIPSLVDTQNLGTGINVPYYWVLGLDKDLTFNSKVFVNENPLYHGEYRQAFKSSNLFMDFGYTDGYKNTSAVKKSGDKSHFFLEFVKNFKTSNNSDRNLAIKTQTVSDRKYLKLYRIDSNLVDYDIDTLESSIDFTSESDDLFLGINASVYESLNESANEKYEYILPELILAKNLISNNILGNLDLQSNFKIRNYDTNKTLKLLVNDFDWDFKNFNFKSGISSKLLGKIRHVNYESKNIDEGFKENPTSELFGALGLLSKIDFYKETSKGNRHILTPKMLIRYAPGQMRKENEKMRITTSNIFSLNRLDTEHNFENGLNATIGFNYEINSDVKKFNFSAGQIINEKENKKMPTSTSLDEKLSDIVGSSSFELENKFKLNYNFSLDQNLNEFNYNEIGTEFDSGYVKFDFRYLEENKHIGDQKYFTSKINLSPSTQNTFSFEQKRNLITDSAEYYDLSYEYINDCLRAGLVYRREFYNDSELEPENTLMFKITLVPFGDLNTPSFN